MAGYKQSSVELHAHLQEQFGALQRACHLYDQGYRAEAKRMATILRVLLHSKRYPSLLKQLGRDQTVFLNTARPIDPLNLIGSHPLVIISFRDGAIEYEPRFEKPPGVIDLPFPDWWSALVFDDKQGGQLTRSSVVLHMANQDGGAHVDETIGQTYAAISRSSSLWKLTGPNGDAPFFGAELAAVRQIAHEVLCTLVPGYSRTQEQASAARIKTEISNGKMRFGPADRTLFKNKLTASINVGSSYTFEMFIDTITTGAVYPVVGKGAGPAIVTPGLHSNIITAVEQEPTGLFGELTDAIIDRVSVRQNL